jgi:SAM-dependent methyltransferase
MKLFRSAAAEQIFLRQRVEGPAAEAEVVVLAGRMGLDIEEVPVGADQGAAGPFLREAMKLRRDTLRILRELRPGRVYALGVPTPEAMAIMAGAEDRHWWYVVKRRLVRELIARHAPPGPCLDVGCGAGATMVDVGRARPTFGVDLSLQALAHARRRGLTGLVCAEAGSLPFAPGSFASVIALDILEHHGTPELLLEEIHRILRPGGLLVVGVPAYQWMWSYADHLLGHYRRYTRGALAAELREAGFAPERLTHLHSWLLPVAWGFRRVKALIGRGDTTDEFTLPRHVNHLFLGLGLMEIRLLRRRTLPFGLSLFALARPTAAGAGPRLPSSEPAEVVHP